MMLGPEGVNRRWGLADDLREYPVRISHWIRLELDRFNPGETRVTHGLEHECGQFGLSFSSLSAIGFPGGGKAFMSSRLSTRVPGKSTGYGTRVQAWSHPHPGIPLKYQ